MLCPRLVGSKLYSFCTPTLKIWWNAWFFLGSNRSVTWTVCSTIVYNVMFCHLVVQQNLWNITKATLSTALPSAIDVYDLYAIINTYHKQLFSYVFIRRSLVNQESMCILHKALNPFHLFTCFSLFFLSWVSSFISTMAEQETLFESNF